MTIHFGFLIFPNVQPLDLTAPYEVFAAVPDAKIHLVWKTLDRAPSATGLDFAPTVNFRDCPPLDMLCVPGGGGVNSLLQDAETLDFLRGQAEHVRYLTAVCTGSLLLGAAGLLQGKRATTHWNAHDFLPRFGAIPVMERVVRDGKIITAGGVTSGLDFGLVLVSELLGQAAAQTIQLALEYAPAPPFASGSPATASPEILIKTRQLLAKSRTAREEILSAAGWK